MIYLTILISLFNIFMWMVFLKKFKSLFSTDDIIASTRDELNRMIEDMNRNTGRDLNLADAKIKELKGILADAEKRIELLNSDLAKKSMSEEFKSALSQPRINEESERLPPEPVSEVESSHTEKSVLADNSQYFSVSKSPVERYMQNQSKGGGTDREPSEVADGAPSSSGQSPSSPSVTFSSTPITAKKDLSQSVMDLYSQGLDVEFIATRLNTTTTEVQLIIDMNF